MVAGMAGQRAVTVLFGLWFSGLRKEMWGFSDCGFIVVDVDVG